MLLSLYGLVWQQGAATATPAGVSATIAVGQAQASGVNIFFGGGGAGALPKVASQFGRRSRETVGAAVAVPLPLTCVCALGKVSAKGIRNPTDEELLLILMSA